MTFAVLIMLGVPLAIFIVSYNKVAKKNSELISKIRFLKDKGSIDPEMYCFLTSETSEEFASAQSATPKQNTAPPQTSVAPVQNTPAPQSAPENNRNAVIPPTYYNISKVPKPVAEAPKPVAEAPKPVAEAPKPVAEAPKPVTEVQKPVAEAPKPVTEVPKPVAEVPKPVTEVQKPVAEAPKPVAEVPKPVTEVHPPVYVPPMKNAAKPVQEVVELPKKRSVSTINIILIIGTLFIVLSGLIFATTTWQILSNAVRAFVVFGLTALFFGASEIAEKKLGLDKTGVAFFILGSIFMPITLLAVGFFKLFGDWFSFFGEGRFWLMTLMFLLLCVNTAAGAVKFRLKPLAWTALFSLTATVLFFAVALNLGGGATALILSLYSLLIVFTSGAVEKIENNTLKIFTNEWSVFAISSMSLLTLIGVVVSGNGVIAFISLIIFSIAFLNKKFSSEENSFGFFPFILLFIISVYKILIPNSVGGFSFIITAGVAAVFVLGLTNIYSEEMKEILDVISVFLVSLSALLGWISALSAGWSVPVLLSLIVLMADVLFYIIKKRLTFFSFLFVILSLLIFQGFAALFIPSAVPTALVINILSLIVFVALFLIPNNPIRSRATDWMYFGAVSIIGIIGIITSVSAPYSEELILSAIAFVPAIVIAFMLAFEKREDTHYIAAIIFIPILFFMLVFPAGEIIGSTILAISVYYILCAVCACIMFFIRGKSNYTNVFSLALGVVSVIVGTVLSVAQLLSDGSLALMIAVSALFTVQLIIYAIFNEAKSARFISWACIYPAFMLLLCINAALFWGGEETAFTVWYALFFVLWAFSRFASGFFEKLKSAARLVLPYSSMLLFAGAVNTLNAIFSSSASSLFVLSSLLFLFIVGTFSFTSLKKPVRIVSQSLFPTLCYVILVAVQKAEIFGSIGYVFAAIAFVFSAAVILSLIFKNKPLFSELRVTFFWNAVFYCTLLGFLALEGIPRLVTAVSLAAVVVASALLEKNRAVRGIMAFALLPVCSVTVLAVFVTELNLDFSVTSAVWFSALFVITTALRFFGKKSETAARFILPFSLHNSLYAVPLGVFVLDGIPRVVVVSLFLAELLLISLVSESRAARIVGAWSFTVLSMLLSQAVFCEELAISSTPTFIVWYALVCAAGIVCELLKEKNKLFFEYRLPLGVCASVSALVVGILLFFACISSDT